MPRNVHHCIAVTQRKRVGVVHPSGLPQKRAYKRSASLSLAVSLATISPAGLSSLQILFLCSKVLIGRTVRSSTVGGPWE